MRAKEEVIFTIIVVILVLVFLAILFLVFIARNNTRKNKLLYENERIKKEFEKTLLDTRLEIQEYTLNYVSREIHDNIGQTLSLARLQLNSSDEFSQQEALDDLLGKAITDLRTLSHSLNTDYIKEQGFIPSIESLLNQVGKAGMYKIDFYNESSDFYLTDEHGLIIFRVIQEILNNITKHAKASRISMTFNDENSGQFILIKDDGCGFDMNNLKSSGIGLKNIKDRVQIIGGHIDIQSEMNKGTQIKISLPNGRPN